MDLNSPEFTKLCRGVATLSPERLQSMTEELNAAYPDGDKQAAIVHQYIRNASAPLPVTEGQYLRITELVDLAGHHAKKLGEIEVEIERVLGLTTPDLSGNVSDAIHGEQDVDDMLRRFNLVKAAS